MSNYALELYCQMLLAIKQGTDKVGHKSTAKPIYLVSIIDLIPSLHENLIEIDNPLLAERYSKNISLYDKSCKARLALPYFHLGYEPFYHIIWRDNKKTIPFAESPGSRTLSKYILGIQLDPALWDLLQDEGNREYLRSKIIKRYLTDTTGGLT